MIDILQRPTHWATRLKRGIITRLVQRPLNHLPALPTFNSGGTLVDISDRDAL